MPMLRTWLGSKLNQKRKLFETFAKLIYCRCVLLGSDASLTGKLSSHLMAFIEQYHCVSDGCFNYDYLLLSGTGIEHEEPTLGEGGQW